MWYLQNEQFSNVLSLERNFRKVIEMQQSRKERAIATIWFVTRLIEMLYPGKVEARWFGSYDEPNVLGYPKVKINAFHIDSQVVLGSWEIDTSGEQEPPRITADDVVSDILIAIRRLKYFQSLL